MVTKPRKPAKSSSPSTTQSSSTDLTNADPDAPDSVIEHAEIPPIPGGDMLGRGIFVRPRQAYELKMVLFDEVKPNLLSMTVEPTTRVILFLKAAK